MTFKNELERSAFEIARRALGKGVTIEHNRTIRIEKALFPEVASFKGPPAKEIDVLAAELLEDPKVILLVSCKLLSIRAEPAHVQEWCSVVETMNRYADGTRYFGLVLSPTGFTNGCEAWAAAHNVGLVPPLKGISLVFSQDTVFRMFERVLRALRARIRLKLNDLETPPAFFDFVFRIVADFEGHHEAIADARYFLSPNGWPGSFGEMYSAIAGRSVNDLACVKDATVLVLSGDMFLRVDPQRIDFGKDAELRNGAARIPQCRKNLEMEPCTIDYLKSVAVGKSISSAGDFGDYLEVGLDQQFNLGLHPGGFHIISTQIPIEKHRL